MNAGTGIKVSHILILEDDITHQELSLRAFRDDPDRFRISIAGTVREARQVIERDPPDLIIADWILPDGNGLDILPRTDGMVTIPLIIMTSFGDEHLAVEIMKSGAIDYVVKSATVFNDLPHIARRALRDWENIHERKRAEEAVRNSEKRLADIISFLPDGVLAIDTEGRVIAWNNAMEQMTGVASVEMLGKGDHEYSIPFYGERRPILIDLVLVDDTEIEKKYDYILRDSERITSETFIPTLFGGKGAYLWGAASPLFDSAGNRIGAIEVIRDITDRKKAEDAVKERETSLNRAQRVAHLGSWEMDVRSGSITWSDELFRILGHAPQSFKPQYDSLNRVVHPDDLEPMREAVAIAIAKKTPFEFLLRIVMPDGRIRTLLDQAETQYDENENPIRMIGTALDITEFKRTEFALRESEAHLKTLVRTLPDLVWVKDPNGVYLSCNRRFESFFGAAEKEIVGKTDYDFLGRELGDFFREHDKAAIAAGCPTTNEEEVTFAQDGHREVLETIKTPIYGIDGQLIGVLGIGRDITERKQVEEALKAERDRVQQYLDVAGVMLTVLDREGTVTLINRKGCAILGYAEEEICGHNWFDTFLPEKSRSDVKGVFHQIMNGDVASVEYYENPVLTKTKEKRIIAFHNTFLRGPDGITGVLFSGEDITLNKKMEEALSESETRFRALIQNSSDIIRILDQNGRILYESPSSERILGYPPGYMIGRDSLESVHTDDFERVKNDFKEVINRTNSGTPTEFRIRKADGEYLWVDSIGTNLLEVPGVNGIVIITRPIQQRKHAEAQIKTTLHQLEQSEALLRKVYDILPIGLWLVDKNGKLLYGNPAGVKIWGAEPHVPIEQYGVFKARCYPSCEEIAADDWALAHTILEGVTVKDELLEIDAFDGKKKIILNYTAPLYDANGAIDGAIVVNQEITDKVKAEKALRQNQARLATAMDIAGLVNWEYDVASGMFTFDERFYALLETTAEREGGNLMSAEIYMREFVHPDDRPTVLAEIQKILATTDPAYTGQVEHRITPRDGSVRTIIARFAPIMGPDGKVIRTYGANQDITDRKLMESEIRSLNTVLEERVKDRTEALSKANEALELENAHRLMAEEKLQASYDEKVMLLKEIHHRVKNNLQIIASLLNLQSRYITDEKTLAAIRESQNRVKAMALVHEKLYRSEDIAHISLYDYIRFLGTGLFQFYDAKIRGIQFTLEIHDIDVDIDAAIPLGLILNELISNSLKYAFPEGKTGEVAISVKKEDHTLTILFRDTGIGIPEDLDWRNTPSLGLRLVTTLVDQMNGTVELNRSDGTVFTMVLHEKEHQDEK